MGLGRSLLALLWPERCPACDALTDDIGLCPRCAVSLYPLGPACPVCAEPQDAPVAVTCRRCREHPPPFARVVAPWRYGGELAVALRRLKYGGRGGGGRAELARGVAAHLRPALAMTRRPRRGGERAATDDPREGPGGEAPLGVDGIVPVPLHPRRLRERGFSQAHALAAHARPHDGPPVLAGALVRVRPTVEQAGLSRVERLRNVAGAFAVPARAARRVRGARILVVDDVVTTGATAASCARALAAAGAASVTVLALARAES